MSEYIEAVLDGCEIGLSWWARIFKISKDVEAAIKKEVYTEESLYKGKPDNAGDTKIPNTSFHMDSPSFVDMELDSTGKYRVIPKVLEEK